MKLKNRAKRNLRAESLETRQLLHGAALAGGGDLTTEERATQIVDRFDANEDMELSEEEVSDRLWNRLSEADGDESATVSVAELTAHLDAAAGQAEAENDDQRERNRNRNRSRRSDRGSRNRGGERLSTAERIDMFFAENDTNEDGVITEADEVSEDLLERIADADVDGNGVSADELLARQEARQEARQQARFEAQFDALDANDDGGITADEVSERRWERISPADGEDGDGVVTAEELQTYRETRQAEREAEREAEMDAEMETDDELAKEATPSEVA